MVHSAASVANDIVVMCHDVLVSVAFFARNFLRAHVEFLGARVEFLNVTPQYWGGPPRAGTSLAHCVTFPTWGHVCVDVQHTRARGVRKKKKHTPFSTQIPRLRHWCELATGRETQKPGAKLENQTRNCSCTPSTMTTAPRTPRSCHKGFNAGRHVFDAMS